MFGLGLRDLGLGFWFRVLVYRVNCLAKIISFLGPYRDIRVRTFADASESTP